MAWPGVARLVDVITSGDFDGCTREAFRELALAEEGLLTVHRVKCRAAQIHPSGVRDVLSYLRATLPLVRRRLRGEPYDVVHLFYLARYRAMLPLLNLGDLPVVVSHRVGRPGPLGCHGPSPAGLWRRADRVVAVCESLGRGDPARVADQRYHGDSGRRGPRPVPSDASAPALLARPLSRGGAAGGARRV